MTFCAGWKYGSSVFLIADSAVTSAAQPANSLSSFGEVHGQVDGLYVEEGLLKLAPIGDHAAVAFAGDVDLSAQILDFLLINWPTFDGSVKVAIEAIEATFGPFDNSPDVAFLFASYFDGGPDLTQWESRRGLISNNLNYCSIGSLRSHHGALTFSVLGELSRLKVPKQDVLPAITALVQSYGIHDSMIDQNVGGAFFGLSVGSSGIQWQVDTGYMLYSRAHQSAEFITSWVRDNALIVHSSVTKETRVMMNSSVPEWKQWLSTWRERVSRDVRVDHFPILVFIRMEDKLITVLKRVPLQPGLSRLRPSGDYFHVDISRELDVVLQQDLEQSRDGSPPFRLVYLRDE